MTSEKPSLLDIIISEIKARNIKIVPVKATQDMAILAQGSARMINIEHYYQVYSEMVKAAPEYQPIQSLIEGK